jgi:hypothetical protein
MAVPRAMCPLCSAPIVQGAYRILEHGEMAHLECRPAPHPVTGWPGGTVRPETAAADHPAGLAARVSPVARRPVRG